MKKGYKFHTFSSGQTAVSLGNISIRIQKEDPIEVGSLRDNLSRSEVIKITKSRDKKIVNKYKKQK